MDSLTHLGRGLIGLVAFIGIAVLFSTNRRRIPWRVVGVGLALQLVLGWAVLKVPLVRTAFEAVGTFFVRLLSFTNEGSSLVFGWLFSVPTGDAGVTVRAEAARGATSTFSTVAPIFIV
ncbi:MAG: Na+ dependent nucleoside transporter N-terminal domain-containing protein, partial [Opitutaceae bacterium]